MAERIEFRKFDNSKLFSPAAKHFMEHGYYIDAPPGSRPFMEYWSEQLRRCKEGYEVNGIRITGDHYFYLNFTQIKKTVKIKTKSGKYRKQKKYGFPDFWDGDYYYFHAVEKARDEGKHLIIAKARRKGFSYKNAAISANYYNTIKGSKVILGAFDKKYLYPDGIMKMTTDILNFLNEHTGWTKRRQAIDKQDHRKSSYYENINGQYVEKGYKSEIQAITFKDNPDAARGKDANLIIYEECGAFDNLKDTYMATKPSVEDGGETTGLMILFGTGGDMEGGTIDFEDMFYNPEPYGIMPFENVWEEGGEGTTCGFFFPDYQNKIGFMDENGNSLMEDAREHEVMKREKIKKTSSDVGVVDKHVTEYPHTPREAFLQTSNNIFPVHELTNQRNMLMSSGLHKYMRTNGKLAYDEDGKLRFYPDPDARPVDSFPIKPGENVTGCTSIFQAPYDEGGKIPDNLYVLVHDPYALETDSGGSLGAAYVIKRSNMFSKPDDIIVASYIGRPQRQDEYNENLFKLAEYYNAKIGFENDRGDVVGYAKRTKNTKWLKQEVELVDKSSNFHMKKLGRTFGTSMGSKQRKSQAAIYLRDWLMEKRGKDENGNDILNLHMIFDVALLKELIKWNFKGNFDRVSSLLVGMYYLQDMHNKEIEGINFNKEQENGVPEMMDEEMF